MIFLSIEGTDNDTDKEVQEEKRPNDHKANEVEDPIGMGPLSPNIVNFSGHGSSVHKVLPTSNV